MGIFDRLGTLLKSNINDLINRAENPEKVLNQLITDMRSQLAKAKQEVASAIADEKKLAAQVEKADAASGPNPIDALVSQPLSPQPPSLSRHHWQIEDAQACPTTPRPRSLPHKRAPGPCRGRNRCFRSGCSGRNCWG